MTTTLPRAIAAAGHGIAGVLSAGNPSDVRVVARLFSDVFGWYVLADRSYAADPFRDGLRAQTNTPIIPGRQHRTAKIESKQIIYSLEPVENLCERCSHAAV